MQKKLLVMEKRLKTLQLFYASVLADSVNHYNNAGILSLVTEKKLNQQKLTASSQLKQLGITDPQQLFSYFSEVFGCIKWETEGDMENLTAKGNHCLLCSIAKKMQTAQPCFMHCINPFRSMLEAMDPSYKLTVEKTLWDSDQCIFKASLK